MQAVVTTTHKTVFAGDALVGADGTVQMEGARMAIYWSAETKGVLGLASAGPDRDCRISRSVPGVTTIRDVTAVFPMTPEAITRWEDEPWS